MSDNGAQLAARVDLLAATFRDIARERMHGLPMVNPALQVEAIGFIVDEGVADEPPVAAGVLLTPWFMSLLRLPLVRIDDRSGIGLCRRLAFGQEHFDFIGSHKPALGRFESCSLFSPVFEFADHEAARATAHAVLDALRTAPPASPVRPARRGFLFGRAAAGDSGSARG